MVTPSVFDDVTAEAARLGIAVAGHLPAGTDLRGASARAMRSIEHLGPGPSVIAACCTDEDDIRRDINSERAYRIPSLPPALQRVMSPISSRIIERLVINPLLIGDAKEASRIAAADNTFDVERARMLARQFVADETWHCPTLIRLRTQQYADDPVYSTDPDLRYMSPEAIRRWRSAARRYATRPTDVRAVYRSHYDRQLAMVAIFDQEGVPMLAGSDAGGAGWEVPGYALHREFDQLAAAGLAPLRILQMVTSNAARFLARTGTMGVVAPGGNADLVLLAADPTQDVAHLHHIVGVAHGGQYLPARQLAALAESVIDAGGSP
jgi:hypothetical protein